MLTGGGERGAISSTVEHVNTTKLLLLEEVGRNISVRRNHDGVLAFQIFLKKLIAAVWEPGRSFSGGRKHRTKSELWVLDVYPLILYTSIYT